MEECTIVMQCLQPRHPKEKVQETLTPPPSNQAENLPFFFYIHRMLGSLCFF